MAIRTLVRSRSLRYFSPTLFHCHIPPPKITQYSLSLPIFPPTVVFVAICSPADSEVKREPENNSDMVNEISRILSDYRSPHHDIDDVVEQVLKRCKNLGFSAYRFFIWAQKLSGFCHSEESFHIFVNILGSSKQFPCYGNSLAYSRAGLPPDAIRAFNKMVDFGIKPCLTDLDKLLLTLCKRKQIKQAQEFFDKVKEDDFMPSLKTYREAAEEQKLFDEMLERGCSVDLLAHNSILESLCKTGKMDEAFNFFMKMRRYKLVPNVFTYNCIIKKLCKTNKVDEAYQLIDEMISGAIRPDCWSYNTILASHCDQNEVTSALKLISRMERNNCLPDKHTYNMLLKMLIRVGRFDRVEKVWESMEDRNFYPSVSKYSVMVYGFCQKKGKLEEACKYFEMMIDEGIPRHQTEILADKMEKCTSSLIQELADIMRGIKTCVKLKLDEEYSNES
ncbi:unnamed protein product [Withania somnifera]